MNCYPQKDGEADVVFTVHWTLSGTDGTYVGSVYGSVGIAFDKTKSYTPYSGLTQDQVISWVQEALGVDACMDYQLNINTQIANQVNPPVVTPPLPWSN
jgi:hypothetical protein